MDSLAGLGSWGSSIVSQASGVASVGAAAAAGLAAKGAKAVKSSLKENLGGFTAQQHTFQDGTRGGPILVTTVSRIAEGAFGEVMKCRDNRTGREYALKVINCQEGVQVASTLQAAQLEAKILSSLPPHPNIIQCFGYSTDKADNSLRGGTATVKLLLELCPGGTLMDYMDSRNGKLSAKEVLDPLAQVVSGVQHMHAQRPPIQHRDLKVENVLQGSDGKWKLCDFGSCSTQSVPAQEMNRSQIMALQEEIDKTVTMLYRPPEMADIELNFRNGYAITEQVDIWMIGCILFTLAFYIHPFQDNATAAGVSNARFFIPTDHAMAKSPKLCALIHWLLAVNPNDRPTCERLCEVLKCLGKISYEELFAWLPPAAQAKQNKFADGMSKRQGMSADVEITPEMAKAIAARKGRSGRPSPSSSLGADSPPPQHSPEHSPPPAVRSSQGQRPVPAEQGFDLASALAESVPPDRSPIATAGFAGATAAAVPPPAQLEDLLGFGAPAPATPQAPARVASAPADLLGFGAPPAPPTTPGTPAPAPQQSDLLSFDAPAPISPMQQASQAQGPPTGGSIWATDFADFSSTPAQAQPAFAPRAASGNDLIGPGALDFADFVNASPPKVAGAANGFGPAPPTATPATGNLLDF